MPSEIRPFLEALFAGKPNDLYLLLWTLPAKRSHWFQDVERGIHFAESVQTDLYVGVGLSPQDCGVARRCGSNEVAGIVGMWADLDLKSAAHPKAALPTTIDEAISILPEQLPPSLLVLTGNGLHAWWLFKEPWLFETDGDRQGAANLVSRFHTLLRHNASRRGWAFDRLSDLARVLRIPGTTNRKDPSDPKEVTLYSTSDRRYNPSDFTNYLGDMVMMADPAREDSAAEEWAARFIDTPLIINPQAAVPEETLAGWIEKDKRFRNTWNRQRHDLTDDTQSGYDLALADFGKDNDLTDQQIIDLIVHHRRLHGAQRVKSLDYYKRTISKASKRITGSAVASSAGGWSLPPCPPSTASAGNAANSGAYDQSEKAKLCDRISGVLGIRVLRLVKVTGKEPVFFMDLDNGRIEFSNVSKLISFKCVKTALAAKAGKVIPKISSKNWDQFSQVLLDACVVEEGTDDLGLEGEARAYIGQYLAETTFITSLAGETIHNLHRPLIYEGKITISSLDLRMHINKTTMQTLSVKAVASMIAALDAKAVRVREGRHDQSRWALPIKDFDPNNYSDEHLQDSNHAE